MGEAVGYDILEYEYRLMFHLSYEDFMKEPFEVFMKNLAVMEAKIRAEMRKQRGLESIKHGTN